jgi:hypothetical protein
MSILCSTENAKTGNFYYRLWFSEGPTTAGSFVLSNLVFSGEAFVDSEGWANSVVRSGEEAATLRCGYHNRMLARREREREGSGSRGSLANARARPANKRIAVPRAQLDLSKVSVRRQFYARWGIRSRRCRRQRLSSGCDRGGHGMHGGDRRGAVARSARPAIGRSQPTRRDDLERAALRYHRSHTALFGTK